MGSGAALPSRYLRQIPSPDHENRAYPARKWSGEVQSAREWSGEVQSHGWPYRVHPAYRASAGGHRPVGGTGESLALFTTRSFRDHGRRALRVRSDDIFFMFALATVLQQAPSVR